MPGRVKPLAHPGNRHRRSQHSLTGQKFELPEEHPSTGTIEVKTQAVLSNVPLENEATSSLPGSLTLGMSVTFTAISEETEAAACRRSIAGAKAS